MKLQLLLHSQDDLSQTMKSKTVVADMILLNISFCVAGDIGRFYNRVGNNYSTDAKVETPPEVYTVENGKFYNFRVINPSLNFAFKIRIDRVRHHAAITHKIN